MRSEHRNNQALRAYLPMEFRSVAVLCAGTVLTGSKTAVSITINEVTVEDYEAGFNIDGNDFVDISFD